jgi:hypothetical protein
MSSGGGVGDGVGGVAMIFLDAGAGELLQQHLEHLGHLCVRLPPELGASDAADVWYSQLATHTGVLVAMAVPPGLVELLPRASVMLLEPDANAPSVTIASMVDELLVDSVLRPAAFAAEPTRP